MILKSHVSAHLTHLQLLTMKECCREKVLVGEQNYQELRKRKDSEELQEPHNSLCLVCVYYENEMKMSAPRKQGIGRKFAVIRILETLRRDAKNDICLSGNF